MFDNLYFVGQSDYSAWAVTTSQGIILIDTLFDYSVEEEVAGGLKKLGLDPATIRYAVVTASAPRSSWRREVPPGSLQGRASSCLPRIGTSSIDSAARSLPRHGRDGRPETHARRHDDDALHHARSHAGHSFRVIPVATARNAGSHSRRSGAGPGSTPTGFSRGYIRSAQRFDDIAQKAGADIILSNHTDWDGLKINLRGWRRARPALRIRTSSARRGPEVSRGRRRMRHRPPSAAELDPEPRLCWCGAHATRKHTTFNSLRLRRRRLGVTIRPLHDHTSPHSDRPCVFLVFSVTVPAARLTLFIDGDTRTAYDASRGKVGRADWTAAVRARKGTILTNDFQGVNIDVPADTSTRWTLQRLFSQTGGYSTRPATWRRRSIRPASSSARREPDRPRARMTRPSRASSWLRNARPGNQDARAQVRSPHLRVVRGRVLGRWQGVRPGRRSGQQRSHHAARPGTLVRLQPDLHLRGQRLQQLLRDRLRRSVQLHQLHRRRRRRPVATGQRLHRPVAVAGGQRS